MVHKLLYDAAVWPFVLVNYGLSTISTHNNYISRSIITKWINIPKFFSDPSLINVVYVLSRLMKFCFCSRQYFILAVI